MGSKIEWTDETWNFATGCDKVSEGCRNCYAERLFPRVYPGRKFSEVRSHLERFDRPGRWARPRRIFVNSMADTFHDSISEIVLAHAFAVMAQNQRHVFQVLTKRPARAGALLGSQKFESRVRTWFLSTDLGSDNHIWPGWPLPNVWLGVSVEDQKTADERIDHLTMTPAALRFISYEPALGPVDLSRWLRIGKRTRPCGSEGWVHGGAGSSVDWVIMGGESGPKARPMHPAWPHEIVDQTRAAGVPLFFKQWGQWRLLKIPDERMEKRDRLVAPNGLSRAVGPADLRDGVDSGLLAIMRRERRKRDAGADLFGRTFQEFPKWERWILPTGQGRINNAEGRSDDV